MMCKRLKVGHHVINGKINYKIFFKTTHWDHRIKNCSNYSLFDNDYIIFVHNKTIVNIVDMKTLKKTIWYIFGYFLM